MRLLNPLLRNTVAIKHFNLLTDYKHPSPLYVHSQSPDAAVHSDLSETSEMFQQLQRKVMDLLDHFPNVLAKLKQVLTSLVLPLGEEKVVPLVDPLAYKNTQTVRELFRLMAPYWNPLSTDLFGLLLEASGCNQAASKVAEFVEARGSKGHLVLCIRQLPTLASGENDLNVADLETFHNAPLPELQSFHPDVFARLPEHELTSTRTTVRISVEVNKPLVCLADYEQITTTLSGLFTVPKAALVYVGCSKAPLVLCWLVPRELVAYIRSIQIGVSGHRLLVESKVTGVAVGDQIYKCLTIKVRDPSSQCAVYTMLAVYSWCSAGEVYLMDKARISPTVVHIALLQESPLLCSVYSVFFRAFRGGNFPPLSFEFPPQTITNFVCFLDILRIFSPHKSNFPPKTTSLEKNPECIVDKVYVEL